MPYEEGKIKVEESEINILDLCTDENVQLVNIPEKNITFSADDFFIEKRKATITYNEPLFIQQFHTLIFNINGQELRFERK